jgi:1-phosphatidylinositol-3-phosphate 5-kinase
LYRACQAWLPILLDLVKQAAGAVQPAAAAAFGENDPRFYIKVKRLPDMGSPADSCVIRGVVAKKNVAHRRMRSAIANPAVLLLSGALEYQRVANKLSSFDTLLDQEREHLRLAVARIAACKCVRARGVCWQ